MMSRNSFLGNMRENLKRRNWIAVIYSVIFFLIFPVGLTLWISSQNSYKEFEAPDVWKNDMVEVLSHYLSINVMMTILVTVLAVICAVQGFSYLFRRQKMDMYMSVPVSKERRFGVIYLNGILLFAVPYLVCLLIGLGISAGNGILTVEVVKSMLYSYLAYVVYYAAVYNITIVAVMMTGNLLVSLCATVVFMFYEIAIKALIMGMCMLFFQNFSSYSVSYKVFCSPVIMMFEGCSGLDYYSEVVKVPYLIEQTGMTVIKILVIAIVAGVIGYLLYAVRPAESCNKAIAFVKTKPVIKVCLMVPTALVTGILFRSITDGNMAMTIFGLVLGIVLSHCILEVIFEFDLKAVLKHLKTAAVGAISVFAVFFIFHFDLAGYDRWVPDASRVESVAIYIPTVSELGEYWDAERGYYINGSDYSLDNMVFTDTESVCSFMKSVPKEDREEVIENAEKPLWITVKYRLKNGTEKYREVVVDYNGHEEELKAITESEEFRAGAYPVLSKEFNNSILLTDIRCSNGIQWDSIEDADIKEFYQNYLEDLQNYSIKNVMEEEAIGVIAVEFKNKNSITNNYEYSFELPVYDSFEKTKAYVQEKGYMKDWRTTVAKDISRITIGYWDENTNDVIEHEFTDKKDIEKIIPALIPQEIMGYGYWKNAYEYDAYVTFDFDSGESVDYNNYERYFGVDSSLLPDFAK